MKVKIVRDDEKQPVNIINVRYVGFARSGVKFALVVEYYRVDPAESIIYSLDMDSILFMEVIK